jgi:hypothetical protein
MKENEQPQKNLSRRTFVKTAAAGLGASALTGIAVTATEAARSAPLVPTHWDH